MPRDAYGEPTTATPTALPSTWSVGEALDAVRAAYEAAEGVEAQRIEVMLHTLSFTVGSPDQGDSVADLFEHERAWLRAV